TRFDCDWSSDVCSSDLSAACEFALECFCHFFCDPFLESFHNGQVFLEPSLLNPNRDLLVFLGDLSANTNVLGQSARGTYTIHRRSEERRVGKSVESGRW